MLSSKNLTMLHKVSNQSDKSLPSFNKHWSASKKNCQQVRQLHLQYLKGEITFRRMAKELGLEYRQLYALLEELNLPLA
jgi:hypothetical protein